MKMLFLCSAVDRPNLPDEIHIKEILYNFPSEHEIRVVAQSIYNLVDTRTIKIKNVNVPFVKSSSFLLYKSLVAFLSFLVAFRILLEEQVDLIYVRHGANSLGAVLLHKMFETPMVTEVNGILELEKEIWNARELKAKILIFIVRFLEKVTFKNSDKIISVTGGIKEIIHNIYGVDENNIFVVPNGANINLFKPMECMKAREDLNLDQNSHYVGFVGSLFPHQGLQYLIQVAPSILRENQRVKFLIVGNGPFRSNLIKAVKERGLEDHFVFVGAVPYRAVPKYINSFDVCVAPFARKRNEKIGLSPIKIYEYLACEKPVVASDIVGVGDLLRKTGAGISVEPENSHELSKAIVKLLKSKKLREKIGKKGRQKVIKMFSWEDAAKKTVEVCKEALKNSTM